MEEFKAKSHAVKKMTRKGLVETDSREGIGLVETDSREGIQRFKQ